MGTILTHAQSGRESTICGRGASRPAFVTQDFARVSCVRCVAGIKKISASFDRLGFAITVGIATTRARGGR